MATFKSIKSKDLKWTKDHEYLKNGLYKKYVVDHPDIDEDTFIIDNANPRKLMSFVLNSNYAKSSKKNILFMIARNLQLSGDETHYKKYQQKAQELYAELQKEEATNQQTDKEKEAYRSHRFLMKIIDEYYDDYTMMSYKNHIKFLVLCLTVLQPPVRTDFYTTAKFITQATQNNKVNNYVFLNARSRKIYYIINDDKVKETKLYNMNKQYSQIEIEDNRLKEILFYSFEVYNREYLLQANHRDNTPISQNTYLNWLRAMTGSENMTNDIMRSSYITWFYNNHKKQSDRDNLALKMRHTSDTAARNYFKDLDEDKPTNENDCEEIEAENEVLKDKIAKCEDEVKNKISDKLFKKRQSDMLYRLNKKGVEPRESSLKRYNIFYNEENEQYEIMH